MVPDPNRMTTRYPKRARVRGLVFGAIGFGLGLALTGALLGAVSFQVNDFNTSVSVGALLFAFGGAIGGALLGLNRAAGRATATFAIASAVALGSGYFVMTNVYSVYFEPIVNGELAVTLAFLGQFALIGAFAGVLLGAVQRDRRQAIWLALAGAVGFALGFLLQDLVGTAINEPISKLGPGTLGEPVHDSIVLAVIFGLSFGLAGIVAGAALGMSLGPGPKQAEPPRDDV